MGLCLLNWSTCQHANYFHSFQCMKDQFVYNAKWLGKPAVYACLLQEAMLYSRVSLGSLKSQWGNTVDASPPGWVSSIHIWLRHPLPTFSSDSCCLWASVHAPLLCLQGLSTVRFLASFLTTLCLILCLQLSSSVSLGQVQEIQSCCCCLVAESCPTLCHPMDCCPPAFSVHGILQGRILNQVATSFSRRSSWPRDWTCVSCIGRLSHLGSLKSKVTC